MSLAIRKKVAALQQAHALSPGNPPRAAGALKNLSPAGMCLLCTVQAPAATTTAANTTLPRSPSTLRPLRPPVFFLPTCKFI